jgi:hypothetical protein
VEVRVADAAEEHLDRHVAVPLNPEIAVKQSIVSTCMSCPTRPHAVSYNAPYVHSN